MDNSREEQAMLTDAIRIREEVRVDCGGSEVRGAVQAGIERGRQKAGKADSPKVPSSD
ncbi:hypothetical protein ACFTAO_19345 [Paenibacillus rhizoplanae]